MALPFLGPCAVGARVVSGTAFGCSPFAKPIASGSSILVFLVTSGSASPATHNTPTDNFGNTYTLIGSLLNGHLNGRTSVWLARNITGGTALQVSATGSSVTWFGMVAWALYGTHTSNGDFVSATGNGTVASVATVTTPAGSIGFGAASGQGNSFVFSPSTAGMKRLLHSEQYDNANGQDLYTDFLEASGPFTASWTISGLAINWSACAFSLSGPTVPVFTAPGGVTQNLFSRTNTSNAVDDASEFEAFSPLYGFAGWMSDTQALLAEQAGTHPWSIRSRLKNFRLRVYVKDAGGATVTRIYTVRKNGIDDVLTITVSGVSSADNTLLSGSDLVHVVDLEPSDRVTLHRTGSGGAAEFDVTHWSIDSLNSGNRVSGAAMIHCRTDNGVAMYGAPLTWKGSPVNDGFRQFRFSETEGRSLVAFNGRITRYDLGFLQNSNLRTANYPYVWVKNGVTQDGSGGTPDTRLAMTDFDVDKTLTLATPLSFSIGDWLQLVQLAPSGTAFNTTLSLSVAIESLIDGEYGLSVDWASFPGGNLGATPRYAGVNKAVLTEAEDEAYLIGPVTIGRMNILQLAGTGPGSGKHLFYRLLKNSATGLEIDLTDANLYGVIEGSVPYAAATDIIVWEFIGSGNPPDQSFIMGIAMAGVVVPPENVPGVGCPAPLPVLPVTGRQGCPSALPV